MIPPPPPTTPATPPPPTIPPPQVYRGDSFGDLFRTYVSRKPLLITEYGVDAYRDVISDTATLSGLHVDAQNEAAGVAYQGRALPKLAREIEAEDPHRTSNFFAVATLLEGERPDSGGGWAIVNYNPVTEHLTYQFHHRTFTDRSIHYGVEVCTALHPWARAVCQCGGDPFPRSTLPFCRTERALHAGLPRGCVRVNAVGTSHCKTLVGGLGAARPPPPPGQRCRGSSDGPA